MRNHKKHTVEERSERIVERLHSPQSLPIPTRVVGPKVVSVDKVIKKEVKKPKVTSLCLISCFIGSDDNSKIRIFGSRKSAAGHIEKHMLHISESYLWEARSPEVAHIIKKYRGCNFDQLNTRDELQRLYNSYANVIVEAMKHALQFGAIVSSTDKTFYLGLSGMFVVIHNRHVRTAFFPKYLGEIKEEASLCKTIHERSKRRKRYRKAIKKNKGMRKVWSEGLKRSLYYFKNLRKSEFDYEMKKELGKFATKSYGLSYKEWKLLFTRGNELSIVKLITTKQIKKVCQDGRQS